VARIAAVTARVGERDGTPFKFSVGGRENIAMMLKDALGPGRIWFANGGSHWVTG